MIRFALILFAVLATSPVLADERQDNAILSGAAFEDQVTTILERHSFSVRPHAGYGGADQDNEVTLQGSEERIALKQPPYTTLYGGPGRYDFILLAPELDGAVWIETKFQKTSGSIDEKAPYVFLNAVAAVPGRHVIILLGGEGWREGALAWITAAQDDPRYTDMANYTDKSVEVMRVADFERWLEATFN